jgi:hypothetical protein
MERFNPGDVVFMRTPENFLLYLSFHENCSHRQLCMAKDLKPLELEVSCDPEMMLLRKMVYAVLSEMHKMLAFVRLKPFESYALYGYLKPKHKIGACVCDHFARRNPGTLIMLGNSRESWISLLSGGKIQHDHCGSLPYILDRLKSGREDRDKSEMRKRSGRFTTIASTAPNAGIRHYFKAVCPRDTSNARAWGWREINAIPLCMILSQMSRLEPRLHLQGLLPLLIAKHLKISV